MMPPTLHIAAMRPKDHAVSATKTLFSLTDERPLARDLEKVPPVPAPVQPVDDDLLFTSSLWARFSFPHRDPGAVRYWQARNGESVLHIDAGTDPTHSGVIEHPVPYGIIPRALMAYLITEWHRTHEDVVALGASERQFFDLLGLGRGTGRSKMAMRQVNALGACTIKLRVPSTEPPYEEEVFSARVSKQVKWVEQVRGDPSRWATKMHLSKDFIDAMTPTPMPLRLEDIRALGSSTLAFDIYVWLTYRLWQIKGPTRVRWDQLYAQFGSGYARMRAFRENFIKALGEVKQVYTEANVSIPDGKDYLMLHPSKPRVVPSKEQRRLELL